MKTLNWMDMLSDLEYEFVRFMLDEGRPVNVEDVLQRVYRYRGQVYSSEANRVYKLKQRTQEHLKRLGAPVRIRKASYGRGWILEKA